MLAPEDYIQSRNSVDFIPSSMVISVVAAMLRLEMGAEKMLSNILEPLKEKYDAIIIDTFPTLGALTINVLAAADDVIITVNPQLLAMMGLQDFLKTVKKIKSRINPKLEVEVILLTMCDFRTNLCKIITEQGWRISKVRYGILTLSIVRNMYCRYKILAGHNEQNAGGLLDLRKCQP